MATIGLVSLSSGELTQAIRQNSMSGGISRNGVVAVRVLRSMVEQQVGSDALTPLLETIERTMDGLMLRGGSHDGPACRWSAWFVAAGAVGAGAAKRHGSPGGSADRAGTGAADGGRGG